MPQNIIIFTGNFLYTNISLLSCQDSKPNRDWGVTNKQLEKCPNAEDRCTYSFKNVNDELVKEYFSKFIGVFTKYTHFYSDLYPDNKLKQDFENIIDIGFNEWEKNNSYCETQEKKICSGSWRNKMKLLWFSTLVIFSFIVKVLDFYNNLQNKYNVFFIKMSWANYVMSYNKYLEIFQKQPKKPYDIFKVMTNIKNGISPYQDANILFNESNPPKQSPDFVIDCGSSGTKIGINHSCDLQNYDFKLIKKIKKIKLSAIQNLTVEELNTESGKIFLSILMAAEENNSYTMLLATAGLRNWVDTKAQISNNNIKQTAENILNVLNIFKKHGVVCCHILQGVNEAIMEYNATNSILIQKKITCKNSDDKIIMFSMGGQSTQISDGLQSYSDDKFGAIALSDRCNEVEEDLDISKKKSLIETVVNEKFNKTVETILKNTNFGKHTMDINQKCDKKRRLFYYKSNSVRGSNESNFIKFTTNRTCDKYDDNHDGLLSLNDYFNCKTDDSGLLGGSKLNTKKRKYTKKRKSNKIKKRKNKRTLKGSGRKRKGSVRRTLK